MARIPDQLVELVGDDGEVVKAFRLRFVTETVHACPEGDSGFTPCCNRTPFELPTNSRMTLDPTLVTCRRRAGRGALPRGRNRSMSETELARWHGGCGEVVNVAAWSDGDAVPSTAGLCDSPEKHRAHAAEPTGDTGAPGGDELREQIAEIIYDRDSFAGDLPWSRTHPNEQERCRRGADAVLALPAARDALAAQETVRRIRAMRVKVQRVLNEGVPILQAQQVADHLDRALGES